MDANKYLKVVLFGGWFGLHHYMKGNIGKGLLYTFTVGLFCVGWISDIIKALKYVNRVSKVNSLEEQNSNLTTKEKVKKLIVSNPDIALQNGEICFYRAEANVGKQVNRIKNYKTSGAYTSVHIMKGVNLHVGGGKTDPKRETFWEKIPCRFYLTDRRIIALALKNGFDLKKDKIMDVKVNQDALIIYTSDKTHVVFLSANDSARFFYTWNTLGQAGREGISLEEIV